MIPWRYQTVISCRLTLRVLPRIYKRLSIQRNQTLLLCSWMAKPRSGRLCALHLVLTSRVTFLNTKPVVWGALPVTPKWSVTRAIILCLLQLKLTKYRRLPSTSQDHCLSHSVISRAAGKYPTLPDPETIEQHKEEFDNHRFIARVIKAKACRQKRHIKGKEMAMNLKAKKAARCQAKVLG